MIRLFFVPPALELATRELADAKRKLLEAQTGKEYAEAMVFYQSQRVTRLTNYIREEEPQ